MMTIIISIMLSLLGIIKRNKKTVIFILLIFIFIMFGWSSGLADDAIYRIRYANYNKTEIQEITGPLYNLLRQIFNRFGFTYEAWLLFQAGFYTAVVALVACLLPTQYSGFPIALLLIYPLCMDVTLQRQTMGACFGWIGILYLYKSIGRKRNYIVFFIIIGIASLIHISCAFYMLYALAKYINDKTKLLGIVIIGSIVLFILGPSTLYNISLNLLHSTEISSIFRTATLRYSMNSHIATWIRMSFIFLSYEIPYCVTKNYFGSATELQEFAHHLNLISLLAIPLVLFSNDIYRDQQFLCIINYCAIGDSLMTCRPKTTTSYNIIIICFSILFAIANLYLLVLRNVNIDTVFWPFYNNNTFIH